MNLVLKEKLSREFYTRATEKVAVELLGKILVHDTADGVIAGKIVETEAYLSTGDEASHSFSGKTKRNEAMFEEGGTVYTYISYGIHYCFNVVTEEKGRGSAVLIRAIEPIEGISLMQKNRGVEDVFKLCKGPGNLCKAFGIGKEHNYKSLLDDEIYIVNQPKEMKKSIIQSERIGISRSKELLLRFYIKNSEFISRK